MRYATVLVGAALVQQSIAGYVLEDDYMENEFWGNFDFFTEPDPTEGFVQYIDQAAATEAGLFYPPSYGNSSASAVSWGVDTTNITPEGRPSIRVSSKKSYDSGLVVIDVEHMPIGCGTWPAFWMVGPDWPHKGEIDILEGVNEQEHNAITLHTGPECMIGSDHSAFAGEVETPNCDVNAPDQDRNAGCSIKHPSKKSYGAGLNANKGGVYATQWTDEHISVWFFPRGEIPKNVLGDSPNPKIWGKPAAKFEGGCDISASFQKQQIIFDTTFCGFWAGGVWEKGGCAKKTGVATCEEFVRDNPEAFKDAFWTVNALKVYQDNGKGEAPAPSNSGYPVVSSSVELPSAVPTETAIPIPSEKPEPTATSTKVITVQLPVSSMTYAPLPTPINGTVPTSAMAPPATFTTEYSGIAPSEILSSTEVVASSTLEATASVSTAPTPTGGAPDGPMGGFKWPGAGENDDDNSPTTSSMQAEPTLAISTTSTDSAVPSVTAPAGNSTINAFIASASETAPAESASPETPTQTLPGKGDTPKGPMSGFQWPTGTGQNTPRNDTATPPPATTTELSSLAPLPSDTPSEATDSAPPATMITVTPPSSPDATAVPTPTTSCTRTTMTQTTPCARSSTTVTEILIPIPTGGSETVFETVFVTIDAAAAATETPVRRKARMERFARKRMVAHHKR